MIEENKFIMHLKVKKTFHIKNSFYVKRHFILESDDLSTVISALSTRRFDLHIVDSTNQVYISKLNLIISY